MNVLNLTVLVENTVRERGLLAEHGLSFLIETGGEKILFDTGQGDVLEQNARKLGIDLSDIHTVVLSHGHYDHTGGVASVLKSMQHRPRLIAHPSAFLPKFTRNPDGSSRPIGLSEANRQAITDGAEWITAEGVIEIAPGLFLTGPVPRTADFEDTGGPFFKDAACTIPDDLPDDQAAFIETQNGTMVILGCAHSGIINTLRHIQTHTANRPIHTVIGGMHLLHANQNRMDQTITELRRFNIQHLHPCHCTGFDATIRLWNEFPGKCEPCPVGTTIKIRK
ncbi:MAG: MBL fold metallo-hydrolase [Verrucomicrobia bacterium]|nr:MBL fold metallo-hydrolase [Verrucomicrobiota bacterium]